MTFLCQQMVPFSGLEITRSGLEYGIKDI